MSMFPCEISALICGYAQKWTVLSWVLERAPPLSVLPEDYQDRYVEEDYCAGGALYHVYGDYYGESDDEYNDLENPPELDENLAGGCEWTMTPDDYLWQNPRAQDIVINRQVNLHSLARNPADWAVDILLRFKTNYVAYPWDNICRNTNSRALRLLERAAPNDYDWCSLGANPAAVDLVRVQCRKNLNIHVEDFVVNPAGEELIRELNPGFNIGRCPEVCENPDPWPEVLKEQKMRFEYDAVTSRAAANPSPAIVSYILSKSPGEACAMWSGALYRNPNPDILAMVRENPSLYPLGPAIWGNPGIFELTIPVGLMDVLTTIRF